MVHIDKSFFSAANMLTEELQNLLFPLPESIKTKTAEIRLRTQRPLSLTVNNSTVWVNRSGAHFTLPKDPYIITKQHIKEVFVRLCEYSVYSHEQELKQGYIVLKKGHRAGVCGTLTPGGMIKDVGSINIRIARQIFGCANTVVKQFDGKGMLIAGPPGSGKTTILRDLIRLLSNDRQLRISVIDTRGEIAACFDGVPSNDLGYTVDVLNGYEKAEGIEIAVRTLNPQIVAFDELGNSAEVTAVNSALNCGAAVIATVHAGTLSELLCQSKTKALLETGAISKIIMLSHNFTEPITVIEEW